MNLAQTNANILVGIVSFISIWFMSLFLVINHRRKVELIELEKEVEKYN